MLIWIVGRRLGSGRSGKTDWVCTEYGIQY